MSAYISSSVCVCVCVSIPYLYVASGSVVTEERRAVVFPQSTFADSCLLYEYCMYGFNSTSLLEYKLNPSLKVTKGYLVYALLHVIVVQASILKLLCFK